MNIAAIILNYFGHADTTDCVKSIVDQGLAKILVLENSADDWEHHLLRETLQEHDTVQVVASNRNLGFAGGVNHALNLLGLSNYDAFLLLNNDTLVPPGMVRRLVKGMESASLDLASPIITCYPETHLIWSKGNTYNIPTGMVTSQSRSTLRGDFFYLTGCCLLVSTQVFRTVGLLDESLFFYGEDVEFCHRAVRNAFQLGVVTEAKVFHKVSSSAVPNSEFYEYHLNLSHFLLCSKLAGGFPERMLDLLMKHISLSARALLRTLRYRNINALKGYFRAIQDFCFSASGLLS